MSERILGPQGSKRRRRFLWVPTLLVACMALFVINSAQAVHDTGKFQLDGDAKSSLNTAGTPSATDDWDKVCYDVSVRAVADGGLGLTAAQATTKCGVSSGTAGATETACVRPPASMRAARRPRATSMRISSGHQAFIARHATQRIAKGARVKRRDSDGARCAARFRI